MQIPLERVQQRAIPHAASVAILLDACSQALALLQEDKVRCLTMIRRSIMPE